MLTPAMIPVTAGKNTANTVQNGSGSKSAGSTSAGAGEPDPMKNDTNDSAIAAMMTYCARIAARADSNARIVTTTVVAMASGRTGNSGATAWTLSANPSVYRATDSACARYNGTPIAPPISVPSERLTM